MVADTTEPFGRNEGQAGRIGAWSGQRETAYGAEERVRHLGEDPGPVAGARVAALRAAVFQVAEHLQGTGHHVMTAPAGQVRDETDAARVMLESGVVKARRRHAFSCRLDNAASRAGTTLALLHRHYITGRIVYQDQL